MTRVVEGAETPIFKQFFKDWTDVDQQQGMGQVKRGNIGNYSLFTVVNLSTYLSACLSINLPRESEKRTEFQGQDKTISCAKYFQM